MTSLGDKIIIFTLENKKNEEMIMEKICKHIEHNNGKVLDEMDDVGSKNQPPLPVNMFGTELKKALELKCRNSV